jgi:molybdopterin/thiamine biosynthesis adenylyltransferase
MKGSEMSTTISYDEMVERNIGVLSASEQARLRNAKVGLLGAGGVGGLCSLLLAKMGCGTVVVYDDDRYEVSNLNRQILATTETIGKPKAEVAAAAAALHAPCVNVHAHVERLRDEASIRRAFVGMDVLLLAVDSLSSVIRSIRAARAEGIPAVVAGPFGWKCCVTVVMPDGPDYEYTMRAPSAGKEMTDEVAFEVDRFQREFLFHTKGFTKDMAERMLDLSVPIVTFAPVVNLTSCLAVSELAKVLLQRGSIFAFPRFLALDLLTGEPWSIRDVGGAVRENPHK